MDSALSETKRKLEENGSFWDNVGNYMGILSVTFFFVTILQILTRKSISIWIQSSENCFKTLFNLHVSVIWESQGKNAKSNKSVTAREEKDHLQAAETTRIYEALEKLAKVSISNHY